MKVDIGVRNTVDLFIHQSNFDVLKRRKAEKEKLRKYGRRRKNWKKPVSKVRGEKRAKKKEKEGRKHKVEVRKRKMVEKEKNKRK